MNAVPTFRCGRGARWLPRTLAGVVLAGAVLAPAGRDPDAPLSGLLPATVIVVGAALALWILRRGSVLRRHVRLDPDGLVVGIGRHERKLEYRDIKTLDGRIPFEGKMQWVPVVAVVDVFDKDWEIPTVLVDGERWLSGLLDRCGRDDLRVWADARALAARMRRARRFVPAGYVAAAGILIGAIVVGYG